MGHWKVYFGVLGDHTPFRAFCDHFPHIPDDGTSLLTHIQFVYSDSCQNYLLLGPWLFSFHLVFIQVWFCPKCSSFFFFSFWLLGDVYSGFQAHFDFYLIFQNVCCSVSFGHFFGCEDLTLNRSSLCWLD